MLTLLLRMRHLIAVFARHAPGGTQILQNVRQKSKLGEIYQALRYMLVAISESVRWKSVERLGSSKRLDALSPKDALIIDTDS